MYKLANSSILLSFLTLLFSKGFNTYSPLVVNNFVLKNKTSGLYFSYIFTILEKAKSSNKKSSLSTKNNNSPDALLSPFLLAAPGP